MTNEEILGKIDHTALKATAAWADIEKLCEEARRYKMASVCIPPACVERAAAAFGKDVVMCTVIGFPLGYNTAACKAAEAEEALRLGAREIDMVINQGDVKNGDFDKVLAEIRLLKKAAGERVLKVIVETCNLTDAEKVRLCGIVSEAGADYIKTSTGFGSAGAALSDIALFKQHIAPGVKIKAAGGIRTRADMEAFLQAGASRIGSSAAVQALGL